MKTRNQIPNVKIDLEQVAPVFRKPAYSVLEFLKIHPIKRTAFYHEVAAGRLVVRKQGSRTIVTDSDYQAFLDALPRVDPKDVDLEEGE
ncbi:MULTISPECIES: hypothetical protein [unclassified Mesorhizobium]|uniref:hypothetical protein n=1 Tax=unclassified Mesorhizobium TaxID=325217 RepID=UPI00333606A3